MTFVLCSDGAGFHGGIKGITSAASRSTCIPVKLILQSALISMNYFVFGDDYVTVSGGINFNGKSGKVVPTIIPHPRRFYLRRTSIHAH